MRGLPAIIALTLKCAGAASVAAAQPVCVSCGPSAAVMDKRDGVVLAMGGGGMGGGGHQMHCGPGCAGGGGGMSGGAGGGMGGLGGGMGGSLGGMGGFGGWDPFLRVPRANCPQDRQKSDRRTRPNSRETELSHCPNGR